MNEKDRLFLLKVATHLGAEFRCYSFDSVVVLDPIEENKRILMYQAMFCFGMNPIDRATNTAGTGHKTMTKFHGKWIKEE